LQALRMAGHRVHPRHVGRRRMHGRRPLLPPGQQRYSHGLLLGRRQAQAGA
jgi:hypothetical protein